MSISIALTKGRLEKETVKILDKANFDPSELKDKGRKLVFSDGKEDIKYFLVKAADSITYVEHGVADLGVVGKDTILDSWLNGIFTKICLSVDSEEELLKIYNSIPTEIPSVLITDSGLTEFNGVPTNTCIGIGPWDSDEIDKITGHLKLL